MIKRRGGIPRVTLDCRRVEDVLDDFERPISKTVIPFKALYCTIQPFVGDTFTLAPDGFQGKDVFTVFTETALSKGKEGGNKKPDEVFISDKWFRVVKVQPWQGKLIPHYQCTVVEIDEGLI